ncbi:MAG: hypothetical protein MRY78_10375 [Saprospiraceae bacterium]|nr:hypothetical protein [Saprospiraceae bacterium]
MITKTIYVTTLLFAFSLLFSCTSVKDLVEEGQYDRAIEVAVKKLAGKKKKKAEHVMGLELAFQKITARDMRQVEILKRENRPDNWPKIHNIYQKINRRQQLIEPLLPLVDEDGVQANFRFVRTDQLMVESKRKSAEHYYAKGIEFLRQAETGDKVAARRAYDQFVNVERYYRSFKDKDQLKRKAHDLGTIHILFRMRNEAPVVLPSAFEQAILSLDISDLDDHWKVFHLKNNAAIDFDYEVVMKITNIEVTPSVVKEREYREEKEIQDGFDYVLDQNGNVMKDTLGNDIKVERYVKVQAFILETYQQKAANVTGRLEFYDAQNGRLMKRENLAADAIFENYAATFDGDRRALSKQTKRRIGNRPVPFPTNEALLFDAAQSLRPLIKDKISRTHIL